MPPADSGRWESFWTYLRPGIAAALARHECTRDKEQERRERECAKGLDVAAAGFRERTTRDTRRLIVDAVLDVRLGRGVRRGRCRLGHDRGFVGYTAAADMQHLALG